MIDLKELTTTRDSRSATETTYIDPSLHERVEEEKPAREDDNPVGGDGRSNPEMEEEKGKKGDNPKAKEGENRGDVWVGDVKRKVPRTSYKRQKAPRPPTDRSVTAVIELPPFHQFRSNTTPLSNTQKPALSVDEREESMREKSVDEGKKVFKSSQVNASKEAAVVGDSVVKEMAVDEAYGAVGGMELSEMSRTVGI